MATMSIGRAIGWLAEQQPDAPLVTHESTTITRAEFERRTNRLARDYAQRGVKLGDFVTIALPNSIEFYEATVATWKLGATPQPISARLPAVERDAIIKLAKPSLVVGLSPEDAAGVASVGVGHAPSESIDDGPLEDVTAPSLKAPTSGGSTGRPKIIVSAQKGVADPENADLARTQLVPGPLYHNAPFYFSTQSLCSGAHLIVMTRFDAETALRLIEAHRVQYVIMVPTMMQRIWRLPETVRAQYDMSSLEVMLHMAAPCPAWLKEAWIDWIGGAKVHELYAGTESQVATYITGDDWLTHRGSVGKPMMGEIRILDEEGNELPHGETGEVFMMPPQGQGSTYRYIGAEAKARDGWESLGDMGHVDADGFLYLGDRKTDMILSGGANIYPAEVEAAIDAHPAVRSSAAIGLPHEDMGQAVHAIIDLADAQLDEAELLAFLAERLGRYKIPRSIEFVREPVRDDAGKVRRSALRDERIGSKSS